MLKRLLGLSLKPAKRIYDSPIPASSLIVSFHGVDSVGHCFRTRPLPNATVTITFHSDDIDLLRMQQVQWSIIGWHQFSTVGLCFSLICHHSLFGSLFSVLLPLHGFLFLSLLFLPLSTLPSPAPTLPFSFPVVSILSYD